MPHLLKKRTVKIGAISIASILLLYTARRLLNKRLRLVRIIKHDLKKWGGLNENSFRLEPWLRKAWASVGRQLGFDVTPSTPWSAATISYWMQRSGSKDFPKSAAHATYIVEARKQRLGGRKAGAGKLELFRLNEYKPRIGDIIVQWRINPRTFDTVQIGDPTHADVVIDIKKGHLIAAGGNVSNTMKTTRFELDRKGFVIPQKQVFAIIKNKYVI